MFLWLMCHFQRCNFNNRYNIKSLDYICASCTRDQHGGRLYSLLRAATNCMNNCFKCGRIRAWRGGGAVQAVADNLRHSQCSRMLQLPGLTSAKCVKQKNCTYSLNMCVSLSNWQLKFTTWQPNWAILTTKLEKCRKRLLEGSYDQHRITNCWIGSTFKMLQCDCHKFTWIR